LSHWRRQAAGVQPAHSGRSYLDGLQRAPQIAGLQME